MTKYSKKYQIPIPCSACTFLAVVSTLTVTFKQVAIYVRFELKMSLQDESFPADEIYDRLNNTKGTLPRSLQRQFNIRLNIEEPDHLVGNESLFLNSDLEKVCAANSVDYEKNEEGKTLENSVQTHKNRCNCNFCNFRNKQ